MQRASLDTLTQTSYDVLVVGGGIYGVMAAREAAGRGLRVALIDKGDFGSGISHNSMKVMHGGIRYVQHLDFSRLRDSARERSFWHRCAADHIRALPFLIPMFGYGIRGPLAFGAAAQLYNLLSRDLRRSDYPAARAIGPAAARAQLGDYAPPGLTGGGLWSDGQIRDANRLTLACLAAADAGGADLANYVEAVAFTTDSGRVTGARVKDHVTGAAGDIRATVTLSCTGTAAARLARQAAPQIPQDRFPQFARAMNIVVRRTPPKIGLGVVSTSRSDAVVDRGGRMYFLTPWQGQTIIGTYEAPHDGSESWSPTSEDIAAFVAEINTACPRMALTTDEVIHCYGGLIPADVDDAAGPKRQTRGTLLDHSATDGVDGLISSVGIKYTTARLIAARSIDLALAQLPGRVPRPFDSLHTPLPVIGDTSFDPDDPAALQARVHAAVTHEFAMTLEDVVLRRSRLAETGGLAGGKGLARLRAIATVMAGELGWNAERQAGEVARTARRCGMESAATGPECRGDTAKSLPEQAASCSD